MFLYFYFTRNSGRLKIIRKNLSSDGEKFSNLDLNSNFTEVTQLYINFRVILSKYAKSKKTDKKKYYRKKIGKSAIFSSMF